MTFIFKLVLLRVNTKEHIFEFKGQRKKIWNEDSDCEKKCFRDFDDLIFLWDLKAFKATKKRIESWPNFLMIFLIFQT